jgi:hypothetical protein
VIEPAKWDETPSGPNHRRAVPWLAVTGVVLFIVGAFVWQRHHTQSERERLVREMQTRYEREVVPSARPILVFRRRVEAAVTSTLTAQPDTYIAPGFAFESLHDARGAYVRVNRGRITTPATLPAAIRETAPDAIGRCLGLPLAGVRSLYERAEFLEPEWLRNILRTADVLRLRAMQDQLGRHIERDLPVLASMTDAAYLVIVVERGTNRLEGNVDVRVLDLRGNKILAHVRTTPSPLLRVARNALGGAPPATVRPEDLARSGGADCSIAGQLASAIRAAAPAPTAPPAAPAP